MKMVSMSGDVLWASDYSSFGKADKNTRYPGMITRPQDLTLHIVTPLCPLKIIPTTETVEKPLFKENFIAC